MIKILFFLETLDGGGAEKVLCNLVNNMDSDLFDITVQTVWESTSAEQLKPTIRYCCIYTDNSCYNHIRYRLETMLGWTYPLHMKAEYDIECAYLECGATKILAKSTNRKAYKLAWVHCDLSKKEGIAANKKKMQKQYQHFDKVVCVSEDARKAYVDCFGSKPEALVMQNVVDDKEIRTKAEDSLPENFQKRRFTVVSVGRLTAPKKYMRLLMAHNRLLKAGLEHDLWIVGEGEDRPILESYICDNGLSNSVTLTGFQQNPYPFMKAADLLVCSSVYEGFSTFITEGLILGKPIVTTECSGMRELLGDSEYGMITENDDDAFSRGIEEMMINDDLRKHYSEKSMQRGSDFSTEKLAEATEKFFVESLYSDNK